MLSLDLAQFNIHSLMIYCVKWHCFYNPNLLQHIDIKKHKWKCIEFVRSTLIMTKLVFVSIWYGNVVTRRLSSRISMLFFSYQVFLNPQKSFIYLLWYFFGINHMWLILNLTPLIFRNVTTWLSCPFKQNNINLYGRLPWGLYM